MASHRRRYGVVLTPCTCWVSSDCTSMHACGYLSFILFLQATVVIFLRVISSQRMAPTKYSTSNNSLSMLTASSTWDTVTRMSIQPLMLPSTSLTSLQTLVTCSSGTCAVMGTNTCLSWNK